MKEIAVGQIHVENAARRLVAGYKALYRFRVVAIEEGCVERLFEAALQLTEGAERLITWWGNNRGKPVPFQILSGLAEPSRKVLDARAELGERSAVMTDHSREDHDRDNARRRERRAEARRGK